MSTNWTDTSSSLQTATLRWNQTGTYQSISTPILNGWANFTAQTTNNAYDTVIAWTWANNTAGTITRTNNITFVVYPNDLALYVIGNKVFSYGKEVMLRGVDKWGFESAVGGEWEGTFISSQSVWNSQGYASCIRELDAMKSININVIRASCAIDLWKNGVEPILFKNFTALAQSRGIYVMLEFSNVIHGTWALGLPYPPYQEVTGADAIITSENDYVNFLGNVSLTMKNYPNVLYDPWTEPTASTTNHWFTVLQNSINRVASVSSQIFVAEGKIGIWVDLKWLGAAGTMQWAAQDATTVPDSDGIGFQNITSPNGNLIFEFQHYNDPASFYNIINSTTGNIEDRGAYSLEDLDIAFDATGVYGVAAKHPVFDAELALYNQFTGDNLVKMTAYYDNSISLCIQKGIHFCAYNWAPDGVYPLINSDLTLTPAGTILKNKLAAAP
jgi:hypothetical protein